jgi:hypothetical protein
MNKISEHPGEFEFVAKSLNYHKTLVLEKEKDCYSIRKPSKLLNKPEKECYQDQSFGFQDQRFGFQRPKMVITSNIKKIKINQNKRKSFPWKKLAFFENEKKIDREEQKRKYFNISMSPKQLMYSCKVFSPKLKRNPKKIESKNAKTSEQGRVLNDHKIDVNNMMECQEYLKSELSAFRDLPLLPFSPSKFCVEKSFNHHTKEKIDLNHSFNKSLDKVIGEAKKELSNERNKRTRDFSDYIYI